MLIEYANYNEAEDKLDFKNKEFVTDHDNMWAFDGDKIYPLMCSSTCLVTVPIAELLPLYMGKKFTNLLIIETKHGNNILAY